MSDRDLSATLRGAGLKATRQRLAVLTVLAEKPHVAADVVAAGVRGMDVPISTQAVYDVLGALESVGLIRRIEPAGSPAVYETRVHDNHHHLVCRGCGLIVDVACVVGEPACLTPSESLGFAVDEAEVTFWGICPSCQSGGVGGGVERKVTAVEVEQ